MTKMAAGNCNPVEHSPGLPTEQVEALAQTFKAMGDPTRIRIIAALLHCELCVHELADKLDLSHSAISHQLAILRDLRLVAHTKQGRHVYYKLDDEHISELFAVGLEHIQHG